MMHSNKYENFSHSGDMGDIIYALPVVKYLGPGNLFISPSIEQLRSRLNKYHIEFSTIKPDQTMAGIDSQKFKFLVDLLENQIYIKKIKHKHVEKITNLDDFRLYRTTNSIYEKYIKTFKLPYSAYESRWLSSDLKLVSPVVIARSPRYQNENFPWKKLLKKYNDVVFVGHKNEHASFCKSIKNIPFYETKNALELAGVIAGAELFIGNQSLPYAIAESLKINTIQETCQRVPDCIFPRSNATYFLNEKFVQIKYINSI